MSPTRSRRRKSVISFPSPPPAPPARRPTTSTSTRAAWCTSSTATPATTSWNSLRPSAGILHDFFPFWDFARDIAREFLRRSSRSFRAQIEQPFLQVFFLQHGIDFFVNNLDYIHRRACGNHHAVPGGRFKARHAGLGDGRQIRKRGRAL